MSTSAVRVSPLAHDVSCTDDELVVSLADGRVLWVPLAWFPRLLGNGEGIHWPDVDEDLSVEGLLRGTPAPPRR